MGIAGPKEKSAFATEKLRLDGCVSHQSPTLAADLKAARLRGESALSVIFRELTPNVIEVVVVEFAIRTSSAILIVSALSFLGLGITPPTADWGLMVSEGVNQIYEAPWLVLLPAVFISTLVVGLNFASDGLANALGLDAARGLGGGN